MTFNRFGKSKFKNKWVKQDDVSFASEGELARWNFLRMMQAEGKIINLRRQIRFKLEINGILICTYIADHGYFIVDESKPVITDPVYGYELGSHILQPEIIEDFKGMETPEFKLKKKLMLAIHGIEIKIVKKPTVSYK